jgi:hypothetical protein
MNRENIIDLFSCCFDSGNIKNKQEKEGRLSRFLKFLETREDHLLDGMFCGDSLSMQIYKDHLLPVEEFGLLLRDFIFTKAGGQLYREALSFLFEMMQYAGQRNMMTVAEWEYLQSLPSELTIYRGGNICERGYFFWSLHKKVAEKYCSYGVNSIHLIQGTIMKEKIFAMSGFGAGVICRFSDIQTPQIVATLDKNGVLQPLEQEPLGVL